MAAINAEQVYKVFGRNAKDGVERLQAGATREDLQTSGQAAAVIDASFTVEEGETFVVMGLSGSGKSTLIRMVNGLLEPTSGSMKIYGQDITTMSQKGVRQLRRERISMVFQHFALFPHRTVLENAAYGLETQGVRKAERREKASEALELCGLTGWEDHLPSQLSGGMRQRVGLARALAAETDVMLMDEAFSALDPLIRREMQDQLVELQRRLSKTILFITHDLNEAMRLGDRIAMMRDGRIVQIGTAAEILNEPANDYVAQFIQDVDRTRVLTASAVMENPVAVLASDQTPRAAQELLRAHGLSALFVVDRQNALCGAVYEEEVAAAVLTGEEHLTAILDSSVTTIAPNTKLADLFGEAARCRAALPVVGDCNRLLGVIPRITLLNALARGSTAEALTEETEVAS